jgi:hypothetical protein
MIFKVALLMKSTGLILRTDLPPARVLYLLPSPDLSLLPPERVVNAPLVFNLGKEENIGLFWLM